MKKKDFIELIKNSKFETAYDKSRRIYSVKVALNKKPYILTMIVAQNALEFSLADKDGNVIEVMRQQGSSLDVYDYKKK